MAGAGADPSPDPRFDRPVFVLGCNRSGTTVLFRTLSAHPAVWSVYQEAQEPFHRQYPIHPELGERVAEAPTAEAARAIRDALFAAAHNKERFRDVPGLGLLSPRCFQRPVRRLYRRPPLRFVEKTPANSLRVPLLAALFPDARFILLVRRGEDVVSSLMEGWKNWSRTGSGPWRFGKWHYLVPPGWQEYVGRSLQEICAFQWLESNRIALEDLAQVAPDRYLLVRHEELTEDPAAGYARVLEFCDLSPSRAFQRDLHTLVGRVFTNGGSAPRREKWRTLHEREIESVRHLFAPLHGRLYADPPPAALSH